MNAIDFEYDSHYLSDFGFVICSFDGSSGNQNVSAGSEITFNTVSTQRGKIHTLASAVYESCIEAEFDIAKIECNTGVLSVISDSEFRSIMRWLNRSKFLRFRLLFDDYSEYENRYFNASFNLEKILSEDNLVGIKLKMITNSPFAYGDKVVNSWSSDENVTKIISDVSDEIGDTFPTIEITLKESGDLQITNKTISNTTIIKNCTIGEKITIDGKHQIICTDRDTHKIYNDFNYKFFKICNTFDNPVNEITTNLSCDIVVYYYPVIKNGL